MIMFVSPFTVNSDILATNIDFQRVDKFIYGFLPLLVKFKKVQVEASAM